jgi:D-serine deaminase-like pyridoxal phosphate-dependent protein
MNATPALAQLPTPTALLDEARMQHNIRHMQQRVSALGARLRPHVKTAKSLAVAQQQLAAGAQGITVSTLKEAQVFFEAGITDILYAVCIAPTKLAQAQALREQGCALKVVVDSLDAAQALVAHVQATSHRFEVLIEIDTDGHRAGVLPESTLLLDVGRTLHDGGATLTGVMTHAGASYDCRTPEALQAMAEQERSRCVRAAQRLREAGLPCPVVSVGSTPTALSAQHLDGVTEVRAGVYVFHDLVMRGVGVCSSDDIALSVLCTVIGHQPAKGWVLVDAGWMAMSRDRGTQNHAVDQGYGAVCSEDGTLVDGLVMGSANQEHGILNWRDGHQDDTLQQRFPVGTRLRVLPNHACATAAQFPHYDVLGADGSLSRWSRFYGW